MESDDAAALADESLQATDAVAANAPQALQPWTDVLAERCSRWVRGNPKGALALAFSVGWLWGRARR